MKKLIFLGILLFIVFIGFFLLWIFPKSKKIPYQNVPSVLPHTQITPVISKNPDSILKYSKTGFVSFTFPSSWEIVEGFSKDTAEVSLRPKGLQVGDFIPSIYFIQFKNYTPELLKSQRSQFDTLKYKEAAVSVNGISGIYLSGNYPFYTKNHEIVSSPLADGVYFFVHNNSLFMIRTRYVGSTRDASYESFFKEVMDSVVFN